MVTHNANLEIKTDADQIIIAVPARLPIADLIQAVGFENAEIRKAVFHILEGGEGSFHERAQRLRVKLQRLVRRFAIWSSDPIRRYWEFLGMAPRRSAGEGDNSSIVRRFRSEHSLLK